MLAVGGVRLVLKELDDDGFLRHLQALGEGAVGVLLLLGSSPPTLDGACDGRGVIVIVVLVIVVLVLVLVVVLCCGVVCCGVVWCGVLWCGVLVLLLLMMKLDYKTV